MNVVRPYVNVIGRCLRTGLAAVIILILGGIGPGASAAEKAPEFVLYDTYGQPVSLKGYRGAAVFLTFGATW
jgi:hypothetical protein